jgi:hypothetical protein
VSCDAIAAAVALINATRRAEPPIRSRRHAGSGGPPTPTDPPRPRRHRTTAVNRRKNLRIEPRMSSSFFLINGWRWRSARKWSSAAINTSYSNGEWEQAGGTTTTRAEEPSSQTTRSNSNPTASNHARRLPSSAFIQPALRIRPPHQGRRRGRRAGIDHMTSSWAPPRRPPRAAAPAPARWRRPCCLIPSGPNVRPGRSAPAPHSTSATG